MLKERVIIRLPSNSTTSKDIVLIKKISENEIKLYGTIWWGEGPYIVGILEEIKADILKVHLHTPGGSVIDGNLIYNHLVSRNVHTFNDGLAASMGAILFEAGKKRSMASNAFIMRHAPTGSINGRAKDLRKGAELLQGMEDWFIKLYMDKNKATKKQAEEWMEGDNYFNAEAAVKLGLADEIFEPESQELGAALKAVASSKEFPEDLFKLEGAFSKDQPDPKPKPKTKPSIVPQNQNSNIQMKKELIESFKLQGVTAESSDTAVIAAMQSKLTELEANSSTKDQELKTLQDQIKAEKETAITAAIDNAVAQGKITATMKAQYTKIGQDSGLETLTAVLSGIEKRTPIASAIAPGSAANVPVNASWDQMQKEQPRKLEAMASADHPEHESFKAMFKARYNKEFQS